LATNVAFDTRRANAGASLSAKHATGFSFSRPNVSRIEALWLNSLNPGIFRRHRISDLMFVHLTRTVYDGDFSYPAGTTGTVVYCYSDGTGFEVEVSKGRHAVLTLSYSEIEPVRGSLAETTREARHTSR